MRRKFKLQYLTYDCGQTVQNAAKLDNFLKYDPSKILNSNEMPDFSDVRVTSDIDDGQVKKAFADADIDLNKYKNGLNFTTHRIHTMIASTWKIFHTGSINIFTKDISSLDSTFKLATTPYEFS